MTEQESSNNSMDAYAQLAEQELNTLDLATVKVVADWWVRYYLGAGHKRLGRLLVKVSKGG